MKYAFWTDGNRGIVVARDDRIPKRGTLLPMVERYRTGAGEEEHLRMDVGAENRVTDADLGEFVMS